MNHRLLLPILLLALPTFAPADEASHKAVAMKLVAKVNSKETMLSGFSANMDAMAKQLAKQGVPETGIKEVREVMTDWFKKEVDFEVIAPKMAEIYMQEFSEDELKQIVGFYDTPLGTKLLAKLPALMQKGAVISQSQLQGKETDLQKSVMAILMKYASPTGAPGGAPAAPTGAK